VAAPDASGSLTFTPQAVAATVGDPNIKHLVWELYDPSDKVLDGYGAVGAKALAPFVLQNNNPTRSRWTPVQGKYVLRCTGYSDKDNKPQAYHDRNFYVWTSTPTANYAGLVAEKTSLEATTKAGSGKSFGEVGGGFAKLKDVTTIWPCSRREPAFSRAQSAPSSLRALFPQIAPISSLKCLEIRSGNKAVARTGPKCRRNMRRTPRPEAAH